MDSTMASMAANEAAVLLANVRRRAPIDFVHIMALSDHFDQIV